MPYRLPSLPATIPLGYAPSLPSVKEYSVVNAPPVVTLNTAPKLFAPPAKAVPYRLPSPASTRLFGPEPPVLAAGKEASVVTAPAVVILKIVPLPSVPMAEPPPLAVP